MKRKNKPIGIINFIALFLKFSINSSKVIITGIHIKGYRKIVCLVGENTKFPKIDNKIVISIVKIEKVIKYPEIKFLALNLIEL